MKRPARKRKLKTPGPSATSVDLDPYFGWALGAGRANFFLPGRQHTWIPVLLKLSGISIAEFAKGEGLFDTTSPDLSLELELFKKFVKVPDEYTQSPDATEQDDSFCMAMVAHEYFLNQIRNNKTFASKVTEVELGLPLDAESLGKDFSLE
jgi:hypothetical protein